jgi:phage anti-repressor protein
MLAKALEWSKEAVRIQNTIRNNYTLACLHYKLENRAEAEAACKLTIEMAKNAGVDQKQPQLLLEKIYEIKAVEKNPAEKK